MILLSLAPIGFTAALQQSKEFWVQTGIALVHHPLAVLFCAAIPAAERAYVLLNPKPIARWKFTLLEAVLTVWRVLLCVAAVWVVLTPAEWQALLMRMSDFTVLQLTLQRLGAHLGLQLHRLLWELFFFVVFFLLLNYLLVAIARRWVSRGRVPYEGARQKAFVSILRNLLLVPLALIYLVVMVRSSVM